MKKILAALLAAAVTVSLAGCSLVNRENSRVESSSRSSSSMTSTKSEQSSEGSTENSSAPEESSTPEESSAPEESTAPEETGVPDESSTPEDNGQSEESSAPEESSSGILGDIIRPEVKEAIDSYEAFVDEYCEFMKKYSSSDNPLTLLTEYMEYLEKATEMSDKFNNMDESDWTAAETAYYTEVLLRCEKKMLDALNEM